MLSDFYKTVDDKREGIDLDRSDEQKKPPASGRLRAVFLLRLMKKR
jgi:hypothetical protein